MHTLAGCDIMDQPAEYAALYLFTRQVFVEKGPSTLSWGCNLYIQW